MTWTYSTPVLSERDFERLSFLSTTDQAQKNSLIEKSLLYSRIYPSDKIPKTVVTMNSQVILQDMDLQSRSRVTLVYPFNAHTEAGKISVDSDLGSRLLGLQVGQTFLAEGLDGRIRKFAVIAIPYQPEAAGNLE